MDRLDWMDRMERLERVRLLHRVDRTREPIFALLVAEWRAEGRTVPAEPDPLWAALSGLAPGGRTDPGHRTLSGLTRGARPDPEHR
ncbi:hypothetical protein JK359_11585 [Streptomyces actinomycinicus]|uniref:Uncharacterized protein n=1 Tax=Streptomyces actinomycinicus TaxID=1695166 RepID=A0A937JKK1_9ACTN|nr:hypothetical protein [Streptomyces actinomycinicus]MBL1082614.1 hypothetical protein [Streptomyces actinomycinicus]